jgi:hypothetical protein
VAGVILGACSSIQPSVGQYAIVTGHGNLSSQQVLRVVAPGQQVHLGSGTTTWYVPANVRNYVTNPQNGDRTQPQQEITGKGNGTPGMADYTYTYVTWELNPAILASKALAQQFLEFCLKYACASQTAQNDTSNASLLRSSSPGWNAMLAEVFPRAIDNATQDAIASYTPALWTDQTQWNAFGAKIAAALPAEMSKMTGTSTRYFCGPGSTASRCTPFTVLVSRIAPVDPNVTSSYQQQVSSAYAEQAGVTRLKAAQEVYGPWANYFLGLQDTIAKCPHCTFYVGNPPVKP